VREANRDLLDDPVLTHGGGDLGHLDVRRKELAHQMIGIEFANAGVAHTAGHRRHVVEVRIVRHRGHRGFEIAAELGRHMLLECFEQILLGHIRPLMMSLPDSSAARVYLRNKFSQSFMPSA
jgi:hypothetical protein